jgi:hypothetical protein
VAPNKLAALSVAVISAAQVQLAHHSRVRELTDLQSDERMVAA